MKARYRLTRRGSRGDTFYCKDTTTGQRVSLKTSDAEEAQRIVNAKNEAERQPMLNLQLAKAYLLGSDSAIAKRTWWDAIHALTETKSAPTRIDGSPPRRTKPASRSGRNASWKPRARTC